MNKELQKEIQKAAWHDSAKLSDFGSFLQKYAETDMTKLHEHQRFDLNHEMKRHIKTCLEICNAWL